MAREIRFKFPLKFGLHARPASHIQAAASRFTSDISLLNGRTQQAANAKSVLSMVSADIRLDDPCVMRISGADEAAAERELAKIVNDVLPHVDDEMPAPPVADSNEMVLPRSYRIAGLKEYCKGIPVSEGVAIAKAKLLTAVSFEDDPSLQNQLPDPTQEASKFEHASQMLRSKLQAQSDPTGVLRAHVSILDDPAFREHVGKSMSQDGRSADSAVRCAARHFSDTLQSSASTYLRERALDVQDVASQLLNLLSPTPVASVQLTDPAIVVADRLTPGQLLSLDPKLLQGLIVREGGTTSHTVILARSMNVPMLVGVQEATRQIRDGQEIILDAIMGIVVLQVTEPLRRYYRRMQRQLQQADEVLAREISGKTTDGHALEVGANVSSVEEVAIAMTRRADGIGLFRTEFLFVNRSTPPTEDEQFDIYSRAASDAAGKPVLIRLLDIGGDKPAAYLQQPAENNPFLGHRGVRVLLEHVDLLKSQMSAIVRAARDHKNLRILVPMISCAEELIAVKKLRDELGGSATPLGVMLEVPSCAFMMEELCAHADFFSIGSNDLAQYLLAADRDNTKVASLYKWTHPPFLRVLKQLVDAARKHNRWIGLCGDMADQPGALPLLIGLRLDEISAPSTRAIPIKSALSGLSLADCERLLEQSLACATRAEVEKLLDEFHTQRVLPLLSADLVLRSDSQTKEEVINEMVTALLAARGRILKPHLVENAIWNREDTYSTGFGHGFALPHCKSDQVRANSLVVAKLEKPIEWGSTDQKPVDVVILMALRESDYGKQHMRVFAQLSRMLMRDEFRDKVRKLDKNELLEFLQKSLPT